MPNPRVGAHNNNKTQILLLCNPKDLRWKDAVPILQTNVRRPDQNGSLKLAAEDMFRSREKLFLIPIDGEQGIAYDVAKTVDAAIMRSAPP